MPPTAPRTAVRLHLRSAELAATLEEWLWTLNGVESITHHMDGEEHYQGLEVIGNADNLAEEVRRICAEQHTGDQVVIDDAHLVHEEDWAESWKKYWHVNRILPHLVIQPSWEAFTPEPGDVVLQLDPGSAFGTGTHETTQLMLYLMDRSFNEGFSPKTLLDVGTGSGILAIYGAKCGVPHGVAIDNDPHAVEVARENAGLNGVTDKITCSAAPLSEFAQPQYEMVIANILAPVLKALMPDLKASLAPGGKLFLGGITHNQLTEMTTCISEHGLKLTHAIQKGPWVALGCYGE